MQRYVIVVAEVWAVFAAIGVALFFVKPTRFLSTYFILASSLAAIAAWVLPYPLIWLFSALPKSGPSFFGLIVATFVLGIPAGALIGGIAGGLIARKVNELLGWTPKS